MKLTLLLLGLSLSIQLNAQWTQITDFTGGPTDGTASFEIDGTLYVAGGVGLKTLYSLDTATEMWTYVSSIPGPHTRGWLMAFAINGKIYAGCGDKGGFDLQDDFYEYDPQTDIWTQKSDFGGGKWDGAFTCTINGKGYVIGGFDGTYAKDEAWRYDPVTDAWEQLVDFPGGQSIFPSGFVIDDIIYVGTGSADGFSGKTTFYSYDPTTDEWDRLADFAGEARNAGVGFAIDGYGYIGGGVHNYDTIYTDFFKYDPMNDTWEEDTSLAFPTGSATAWSTATVIGNTVYMGTGADFNGGGLNFSDDFYKKAFDIEVPDDSANSITEITTELIALYPNPANAFVTISLPQTSRAQLRLIDIMGRTVLEQQVENGDRVAVSNLSSGTYTLLLINNDRISNGRLIVN